MPATSTSTDPVQTIHDLLSGTPVGDWPGGTKPTHIELQWTTPYEKKIRRNNSAVYVWSPERGTQRQLSTEGTTKDQEETVVADVWSRDAAQAATLADDVVTILDQYHNDKTANTEWLRIRPREVDDRRAEARARRAPIFIIGVTVGLRREGTIGP